MGKRTCSLFAFVCLLGMGLLWGTACSGEQTYEQTEEQTETYTEAYTETYTENYADTASVLAAYGIRAYQGEGASLGPAEGILYLPRENGTAEIYYQGIYAGYAVWLDLPAQGDAPEDFGLAFEWNEGNHAICNLLEQEEQAGFYRMLYAERLDAYSYGETEWLLEAGLFSSIEEALAEGTER